MHKQCRKFHGWGVLRNLHTNRPNTLGNQNQLQKKGYKMNSNQYDKNEAIEIRFRSNTTDSKYQLLATAGTAGNITLHLKPVPYKSYSKCISDLYGADKNPVTIPMKSYANWQDDLINWLNQLTHYTITEIK
jgi:hypothetical protein